MSSQANQPSKQRLLALYLTMARIRAFEEAAEAALSEGLITGAVHLSIGQEAVATGVCGNLKTSDLITSNHRGHGHTLAKGADPGAMMQELFGRAGGTCGGKGGSMHIADFSIGMLGANGVVGAGIPIAVGAAQGLKLRGEDRIVVCFFGDGALNRGPFLEGLNWAKIFELPVLFVCEENGFAATTRTQLVSAGPGAAARAAALGIPDRTVDGNDVAAVDDVAGELIHDVRSGKGPQFLLARTYRLKGHTCADPALYRSSEEVDEAMTREPIGRCRAQLLTLGAAASDLDGILVDARNEMADVVATARQAPYPAVTETFTDVQDLGRPA